MNTSAVRVERINMRATQSEKSLLAKAADIAGFNNLTNFIMLTAKQEAKRILDGNNKRMLSSRDQSIVMDLLQNPPKPSKQLCDLLTEK